MTTSWLGQFCINVSDLEASVARCEALGLLCDSRTEIEPAWEAVIAHPGGGSRLQLAQQKHEPFGLGTAIWKYTVHTHDLAETFARAQDAGFTVVSEPTGDGTTTTASVLDPDGYLIDLVQQHPWPAGVPQGAPWLGPYCINVTDLDATLAFYERLFVTPLERGPGPDGETALLANPDRGSTMHLTQRRDQDGPIVMGSMWKLYVNTTDCRALYEASIAAGAPSHMEPTPLERWPVTVAFVLDPDGYLVEFVELHAR